MAIKGKKILIFAGPEFEDLELWYPKLRLREAGAEVIVAGLGEKVYQGRKGYPVKVDMDIRDINSKDFDALVVPGGFAPDKIRQDERALSIVREMNKDEKIIASICHAAWVPISAGIVKGKQMTCVKNIKDDLMNAGAEYVDRSVVVDGNIVSSRVPDDLPDFCREIIRLLEER